MPHPTDFLRISITDRFPQRNPSNSLDDSAHELLSSFAPTSRFGEVRFETYQPNPEFESQKVALERLQHFAHNPPKAKKGFLGLKSKPPEGVGLYLDGGFGVGKTHLLAATWHTFQGSKVFLSFAELLYTIGALGMQNAITAFRGYQLLCIDEFELDDPGNTHMVNTFLSQLMPAGTHVVTSSNTQPGQLGQGRFNASDFQRQITGIASRFETLHLDGPDYRQRQGKTVQPLSTLELDTLEQNCTFPYTRLEATQLNHHLSRVHPIYFGKLLEGIHLVLIENVRAFSDQNLALRFVHFIDKVYDLNLRLALSGTHFENLFDSDYRFGAFQKKYSRCLSRLSELIIESQ